MVFFNQTIKQTNKNKYMSFKTKRIKAGLKDVIKLDKNFHIYIHGSSDKVELGESKTKGKWIKLYYKEIRE